MKHFDKYLAFCLVIIAGCDTDPVQNTVDKGIDYFPLRVGFYQEYHVEEITYVLASEPDTSNYELLVEVTDSFPNATGTTTYVIHRSMRSNATSPWIFKDTWSARVDEREAVYIEGNTPFVKLTFPLAQERSWDGNIINNKEEDFYEVIDFDVPRNIGGTNFDRTLTVEQEFNDDPIVFTDIRSEVYARGIGLVLKETTQLQFCQAQTCSGNELIESGIIYKQVIKAYGYR